MSYSVMSVNVGKAENDKMKGRSEMTILHSFFVIKDQ